MKKDIHNNFIKNGSLCIKELKVIKFNGDKEKIDEFLNGQITSDHKQLTNNAFQLSSICNHKGQVIADFIVNKSNEEYRLVINDTLKTTLINELNPFIKLHRLEIEETNNIVIGNISTTGFLRTLGISRGGISSLPNICKTLSFKASSTTCTIL